MPPFGRPSSEDDQRAQAWRDWIQQRHPLAIASFVLGLFSLIEFGALLIFGIAGIILGGLSLAQLRQSNDGRAGRYLARAGIILSAISLIIASIMYLWPRR